MSDERAEGARFEVNRLLEAGVIRPVEYPEWLANVVMVKKPSGKWRICIDFTNLNKACPKDEFPLPRIDNLVDVAANSEMMSLLDGYSGITKYGFERRMNQRQVSLHLRGPIVTSECLKVSRMWWKF